MGTELEPNRWWPTNDREDRRVKSPGVVCDGLRVIFGVQALSAGS